MKPPHGEKVTLDECSFGLWITTASCVVSDLVVVGGGRECDPPHPPTSTQHTHALAPYHTVMCTLKSEKVTRFRESGVQRLCTMPATPSLILHRPAVWW